MNLFEPTIILIRPQLPENIGMVARAMQNCGLNKLILVSPREKWPNNKALSASSKAKEIIKKTKIFKSIDEALSSFNYVIAATARKRFLNKPHQFDFKRLFKSIPINNKIAIIFGPENSGLSNDDLKLCDMIFSIPISKNNNSLNLSHSVLLIIYKWQEYYKKFSKNNSNKKLLSTKKDFFTFMNYLKKELDHSGFLYPKQKREKMFENIQSMFLRAQLSKAEIQTLWGIIKSVKKPTKR